MFDLTRRRGAWAARFADNYNGIVVHLAHRDISFVTVSARRLTNSKRSANAWAGRSLVSAANTDFSHDYNVSFTDQEIPGGGKYNYSEKPGPMRTPWRLCLLQEPAGRDLPHLLDLRRGLEDFLTAYCCHRHAPKGCDEEQVGGMGWFRHHDRYEDTNFVVPWAEKPGITAPIIPK